MSHTIYHTKGFIVSSFDTGESNKFFRIYTKDHGLVNATAQGVRLMKSKLRYSLQDSHYCDISLVRGKDIWRITSASINKYHSNEIHLNRNKRIVFSKIIALLRKLIQGEEADPKLFKVIENGYLYLGQKDLDEKEIHNLEIILVLQILNILGYLDTPETYLKFVESDVFSASLINEVGESKQDVVSVINNTLESIDM